MIEIYIVLSRYAITPKKNHAKIFEL